MIRTHKENSLGGSTLDTLWTGLGLEVLLTFLSLVLIQKQLAETKIFGQFVDARQKIFGRGYSVEL